MERHQGTSPLPEISDRQLLSLAAAVTVAAIVVTTASVIYTTFPLLASALPILLITILTYVWILKRFTERFVLEEISRITEERQDSDNQH